MVNDKVYQALMSESSKIGTWGHGFTYSGHPVAAAVALEAQKIYDEIDLFGHAKRMSPVFTKHIQSFADHPLVGEARGLGLVGAIELVADKASKRSFEAKAGVGPRAVRFAEEEGLIVRFIAGDVVSICPPLIITKPELDDLFARLARALDRFDAEMKA